jgi:hypothetical protein
VKEKNACEVHVAHEKQWQISRDTNSSVNRGKGNMALENKLQPNVLNI